VFKFNARVQLDRNTLARYLHHLSNARLIALLYPQNSNLLSLQNKDMNQIRNLPDGYWALDQTEVGIGNKVPLWLFGFLY